MEIAEALELVPVDGTYILPTRRMRPVFSITGKCFEQHGWQIPETWDELAEVTKKLIADGTIQSIIDKYITAE